MRGLGYGPDNRLKLKVMTGTLSFYKTPAILLIDQLKEVYLDGELESVETPVFPRIYRKTTPSRSTYRPADRSQAGDRSLL